MVGVCAAKSAFFAVGGELPFFINDLPGSHSAPDEVARQVFLNHRGATSSSMWIEKSFDDSHLGLSLASDSPDCFARVGRLGLCEGTAGGPSTKAFPGIPGQSSQRAKD
jgi:hypothetical protein